MMDNTAVPDNGVTPVEVLAAPADSARLPFSSMVVLVSEHSTRLERLSREKATALSPKFTEDVEIFLDQAAATGTVLDFGAERAEVQSYLNFWANAMFTTDRFISPRALAPYDKSCTAAKLGDRSPYIGFSSFGQEDSTIFFGRSLLVGKLVASLGAKRFITVTGISGSGKSSLVKAGLVSALKEGAWGDSQVWIYIETFAPGRDPLRALARALHNHGGVGEGVTKERLEISTDCLKEWVDLQPKPVLIVIDQFEELYTLQSPPTERAAFASNLGRAMESPKLYVVLTMRSEYEDVIAKSESLQLLYEAGRFQIPPLRPRELREAIERPAARLGVHFEPRLAEELVQSVLGEPAGLPLLEFTLLKLWEKRDGETVRYESYLDLGGDPAKILAKTADDLYHGLEASDQMVLRSIFLSLIQLGEGLRITRQWATRKSLSALGEASRVDKLIERLQREGFLRKTAGTEGDDEHIEITHEALTQRWPRLQAWMVEDLGRFQQQRLLKETVRQHNENPERVTLYEGRQLEDALELDVTDPNEREFLRKSKEARDKAAFAAKRLKFALVISGVIALVLIGFSLRIIERTGERAETERLKAEKEVLRIRAEFEESRAKDAARELNRLQGIQKVGDRKTQAQLAASVGTFLQDDLNAKRDELKSLLQASVLALPKPTIYFHYVSPGDASLVGTMQALLRSRGFNVRAAQLVPSASPGIEVRYFHTNPIEGKEAIIIAQELLEYGLVKPQFVTGYAEGTPERYYEIWMGADSSRTPTLSKEN